MTTPKIGSTAGLVQSVAEIVLWLAYCAGVGWIFGTVVGLIAYALNLTWLVQPLLVIGVLTLIAQAILQRVLSCRSVVRR